MERELARYLLLLVNEKETYDRLQALIEDKIKGHLKNLEKTTDTVRIFQIQGAISELRRWEHLKESIRESAE
jgi:Ribonuclease G/E